MSGDTTKRYDGPRHRGDNALSPYPKSRLAPVHDLIDTAAEIADADRVLGAAVNAKMEAIVAQIRALQAQAREVLAEARDDALLHRAACNFKKVVGHTYHLYDRGPEQPYFSMLTPEDWRGRPPHHYRGSFRLEPDMSWKRVDGEHGIKADAPRAVPRFELRELLPSPQLDQASTPHEDDA